MRPSTRALMTFARRGLTRFTVSEPPFELSGSFCAGLTCFHQQLRSSNPGGFYLLDRDRWGNQCVRPTSGRDDLRARGPIFCAMGEYRPGDACMLGGERDGGDVHVSALLQPSHPGALGIGFLVDDAQVRSRAVHQKGAQIPSPWRVICPSRSLPPLECCRGVIPSEAA